MHFFTAAATLLLAFSVSTSAVPIPDADVSALACRSTLLPEIKCGSDVPSGDNRRFRLNFRGISEDNMGQDFLIALQEQNVDLIGWGVRKGDPSSGGWYAMEFVLPDTGYSRVAARNACGGIVNEALKCWPAV